MNKHERKEFLKDVYIVVIGSALFAGIAYLGKLVIVYFNGPFN